MSDPLFQLLFLVLSGLTGSALTAVANWVVSRGQREKTEAKIDATKADVLNANSALEARTDKLRQEALESSLRRADDVEKKFETTRSELVTAVKERAHIDGQLSVMQLNQSDSNLQIQRLSQELGEQKALTMQATQSGDKYQSRVEALEAQVQDLQKQVKNLTEMLAQVTKERDTAVDKLAAQTPAAAPELVAAQTAAALTAPAGATP